MLSTFARGNRNACPQGPDAPALTRTASLAGVLMIAIGATLQAQAAPIDDTTASPHVRPTREVRTLVDDAARGSGAIRALMDRLEALDVTVYIRAVTFADSNLEGRAALLAGQVGHRYLVIELACGRSRLSQMATLGHELHHAVEIAEEPSVVDARTLAALYERIGRKTSDWNGRQTFETDAAADAGLRARRELLVNSTRRSNGT
jgi:hypothetical protein